MPRSSKVQQQRARDRSLRGRLVKIWRGTKRNHDRPRWYWPTAFLAIACGVALGRVVDHLEFGLAARYPVYQAMLHLAPQKARAGRTALVLIGDVEYRGDELKARSPIRRDYLARLLRAIDAAEPALIAIDFNLEAAPQYADEDGKLVAAVKDVSSRRPIVLPVTLEQAGHEKYRRAPQLYPDSICSQTVRRGHIQVSEDVRPIPVALRLVDGSPQDSFAEAIVRFVEPAVLAGFDSDEDPPFATFLRRRDLLAVSAASVLSGRYNGALSPLHSKIVIVSGDWQAEAISRRHIDDMETPAGVMPGSMVQANYVEALLGSRSYRELNEYLAVGLEVSLALCLALLFERSRGWKKLGAMVVLCCAAVFIGYVLLENLGRYYDFYWPVIFLVTHGVAAEVIE